MTSNTLDSISIINIARDNAGLPQIQKADLRDTNFYDAERRELLTLYKYSFARKKINISNMSLSEDGFVELPEDFLAVVSPRFEQNIGNRVIFATEGHISGEMIYVFDETITENWTAQFANIIILGITVRYSEYKQDASRISIYTATRDKALASYNITENTDSVTVVTRW